MRSHLAEWSEGVGLIAEEARVSSVFARPARLAELGLIPPAPFRPEPAAAGMRPERARPAPG
ncbi:hypothetical protein C0R01_29725 [Streptomyces albidoflavus]|uniref:hypothetical protein n=1 Tax=Streptomyces albidoflavus TaxID=1886 RepID=UPI00101E4512|nr:hypothetical protein [Streptomyces albidoflavus]NEC97377.1 hypothetical protein [Streptomyces albidoflavus]RZE56160.1 hypothetical protein C0R00_30220 [Streptomyces albidoflavus]RZE67984.1 hypothetical protein C0R01_29725 [Streptomyces albidoflavus]